MPDKRDVHQAKSHRNAKQRNQSGHGRASGQADGSGRGRGTGTDDDRAMTVPMRSPGGKRNKSKH